MLDGAVKTILVDDSQPVSQLMVVICTKIGLTNHDEYGLVREIGDPQNENQPENNKTATLTLRRKIAEKDRDAKMESLRKKLRTDDESKCESGGGMLLRFDAYRVNFILSSQLGGCEQDTARAGHR